MPSGSSIFTSRSKAPVYKTTISKDLIEDTQFEVGGEVSLSVSAGFSGYMLTLERTDEGSWGIERTLRDRQKDFVELTLPKEFVEMAGLEGASARYLPLGTKLLGIVHAPFTRTLEVPDEPLAETAIRRYSSGRYPVALPSSPFESHNGLQLDETVALSLTRSASSAPVLVVETVADAASSGAKQVTANPAMLRCDYGLELPKVIGDLLLRTSPTVRWFRQQTRLNGVLVE